MSVKARLERLERAVGVPEMLVIEVEYIDEATGEISPPGVLEQIRPDLAIRWPAQEDHPRDSP